MRKNYEQERQARLQVIRRVLNEAAADPIRYSALEVREHFDRLLIQAEKKATRSPD